MQPKGTDRLAMLCDFSELNWIFSSSDHIDTFLQKIVHLVSDHMSADSCAVFLWNEAANQLVLRAAKGFAPGAVGKIRLKPGEGLAGLCLVQLKAIQGEKINQLAGYKPIAGELQEGPGSFLAVPILKGIEEIGVITAQAEGRVFVSQDLQALRVIASQMANIIDSARMLLQVAPAKTDSTPAVRQDYSGPASISGVAATSGCALGEVLILERDRSISHLDEGALSRPYTLADFEQAVRETEVQLSALQEDIEQRLDDAASLIFSAHLLMLKDPAFIDEIYASIRSGVAPPRALLAVAEKFIEIFSGSPIPFVREKTHDLEDLVFRVMRNLDHGNEDTTSIFGKVVIAGKLLPSDLLRIASEKAAGVILVSGGTTTHVSILARSLRLPLVIVDNPGLLTVSHGTTILLDADRGTVYLDPPPDLVEKCRKKKEHSPAAAKIAAETHTPDGTRVYIAANASLLSDVSIAMEANAEGIGLYRSEYPFLIRTDFPTEEEQHAVFSRAVELAGPKPITFRTLDVGGDKIIHYYQDLHEANPFLGMRSMRFALKHKNILSQQLRAMLRAGAGRHLRIMFPMISSLDELLEAKAILNQCRQQLRDEGTEAAATLETGIMVELPSAVELITALAKEADFLSIGTNDLIQYTLAVDRSNEKVAEFYLPHHPAVLRSLDKIAKAARMCGKEVSVCGDMGSQPRYLPFLLGIGIRRFSMAPIYLARAQQSVKSVSIPAAERLASALLQKDTIREVAALLDEFTSETFADTAGDEA